MKKLTLMSVVWTLSLIVIGMIMLLFSDLDYSIKGFDVGTALSTVGTFLIIASIISFYFETVSKTAFFNDISDKMSGSVSFRDAALQELFISSKEIRFSEEIKKSKCIKTVYTYSDNFIKVYNEELDSAIKRGAEIEFYFLNKNSKIIEYMIDQGWQRHAIYASYETIAQFSEKYSEKPNVRIKYFDAIPRYAGLFFDSSVYIIEQTISSGRTSVPALKLAPYGNLAKFYISDIERLEKKCEPKPE